MTEVLTSPSNPRIQNLVRLRERSARDEQGVFIVEGTRLIGRAVHSGADLVELYFDQRLDAPPYPAASVFPCSTEALDRASYRAASEGVIGVFRQFPVKLEAISLGPQSLVLMTEGLEKPGNLGAILRTADAVGAEAVVAIDPATDPFNPNVVRTSTGALFTVPLGVGDLTETSAWLRANGLRVVAAQPGVETALWDIDLTGSCAILVGAEHRGLSPEALALADAAVSIPMRGLVDSLNASVSMAVLAYESLRQRRRDRA